MEVSLRDAVIPVPAGRTLLFDVLHDLDISALECTVDVDRGLPHVVAADGGAPFSLADRESVAAFKQRLADEGLRLAGLLLATDFSGDAAESHVAWAVEAVRAARELGAPVVRIDTATRRSDLPLPVLADNFVRCVRAVLEQTADTGVDLGIENHGVVGNNPEFLDSVLAQVKDPRLGMTLDTGNFYWYGLPLSELYATLERYAPRARHTHIKNIAYPAELAETRRAVGYEYGRYAAPLADGNIDLGRVVQILRNAGYDRTLCIEDESLGRFPPDERLAVLRRDAEALRAAIARE